jgi:hypothetical protein
MKVDDNNSIEYLFTIGKLESAKEIYQKEKLKRKLTKKETWIGIFIECIDDLNQGNFISGEKNAVKLIDLSIEMDNSELLLDSYFVKIEHLIQLGKKSEVNSLLILCNQILNEKLSLNIRNLKQKEAYLYFLEGRNFYI